MPAVAPPLPARVAELVPKEPPADIDSVIRRLRQLQEALPRGDGTRYFNRLYLQMTEAVARLVSSSEIEHPQFLERLDVVFAEPYFRTVASAAVRLEAVSPAWQPLFEARRDRRVAAIQFALAGVNAHINFDLAIGVVDTCRSLNLTPEDGTPQHRDYERIKRGDRRGAGAGQALARHGSPAHARPHPRARGRRRRQLEHRQGARGSVDERQGPVAPGRGPAHQRIQGCAWAQGRVGGARLARTDDLGPSALGRSLP